MKTIPSLIALVVALLPLVPQPVTASVAKPVAETIEQLAKLAGRVPAKGAAEALEIAWRASGKAALQAAESGGLGLTEAAARHGSDVLKMAVRVPEAAAVLATRAREVLPLAREFGDDILRIEAKVPGLANDAVRSFPSTGELRRLAALPGEELRGVLSYASHATDPAAARALLEAVEKKGGSILTKLDSKQILASGLTTAMVITAAGGAVAMAKAPQVLPQIIDILAKQLGTPVGIALGVLVLVVALPLALRLSRFLPTAFRRRPSGSC